MHVGCCESCLLDDVWVTDILERFNTLQSDLYIQHYSCLVVHQYGTSAADVIEDSRCKVVDQNTYLVTLF